MERHLAQFYMQSGMERYDSGYYTDAEKILQMAQKYRDNLDPLDRRKLDSMLAKASQAAAERKRALEVKRSAELSLRKGETAMARAQLEGIEGNQFLTEKERLEVAETLRSMERPGAPGTGLDNVTSRTAPAPGDRVLPQIAPGQEKDRLAALYYQSMVAYYSGDLQKAKQGFTEVLKSDLLPAPTAKAVRGYLAQIAVEEAKSGGTQPTGAPTQMVMTTPPTPTMSVMGAAAPYRAANESGAAVPQSELTRIQELYNRSWELYAAGQLEEARKGFVEVAKSGLFAAPEGKRPEDYIATIDRLLSEEAKAAVDANQPLPANATAPAVSAPAAPGDASVTPLAAAPTGEGDGGYVQVINRRRNLICGHTQAVVNDAVDQTQKYMAQSEFDRARETCFNAQCIVNQNQLYLGDALYRQYTQQLETTSKTIDEAEGLRQTQQAEQRRQEAVQAGRELREQADVDRKQRIDEFMQRAKAYQGQQRYEAALGQLEAIIALDALNDEALRMKQMVEDTIYLRKQLDVERLSSKERAEIFMQMDETGVPYANEITYPKNWREISEKPTRKPDEPIQLDPANTIVYQQLEQVVDLSSLTPQMGLSEAIETIKKSMDPPLNIVVLWREMLDNAQIEPTTPINMDGLPSAKLGTALENLLNAMSNPQLDIRLDYIVNKGVITIGTDLSLPPKKMETRVYDISDLVGEPANYAQMGMMGMMGGMMGGMGGMGGGMGGMGMGGMGMGGMGGGYGGMGGMGMGGMGGMGGYGGMGGGMGMGGMGGGMGGMGGMGMGGMGGGYGGMGGMGMGGMGGGYGGMGGMGGMGMGGMGMGGMGMGMGGMGMTGYMSGVMAQSLRYLIEQTVEPDTWFDLSDTGEGTITPYPDQQPKKLAIYQTPEVHQQIRDLLDQLRKSLGNEVSIEARFLAVTENFLEDIGLDFDFSYNLGGDWGLVTVDQGSFLTAASTPTQVSGSMGGVSPAAAEVAGGYGSVLDDLQVSLLLRATQGRTDSKSLAAPKLTVLSGESANFSLNDTVTYALPPNTTQTTQPTLGGGFQQQGVQQNVGYIPVGSNLTVSPTITKDKKHVLLNIMTTQTDLLRIREHQVSALVQQTTTTGGTTTTGAGQVVTYPLRVPETEYSNVMTRVSVPDRGTLLLGGHKITIAVDKEVGVPILSKIPLVNRLFTNRSSVRDQKVLLILVKPTIILQEETDQEAIAALEEKQ